MNAVTRKMIFVIGPIVLEKVLNQIINEEKLTSFRDNLITYFRKTADKTTTEVDDYLVEFAIDAIMEPGKFIEQTRELCGIIKGYIEDSRTEIDDIFVLPIITRIEELGTSSAD